MNCIHRAAKLTAVHLHLSLFCLHCTCDRYSSIKAFRVLISMTVAVQNSVAQTALVSVSQGRLHPRSFLPCKPASSFRSTNQRGAVRVYAQQQQQEKPGVAKFADSVGLPTEEGLFGFKPFPEVSITRMLRSLLYEAKVCGRVILCVCFCRSG